MSRILFVLSLALVPVAASAQSRASIAGIVRDTSGAVLPGVTVEASSPVLIERSGRPWITELLPGPYIVTFTLTGFSTLKREGIELSGALTVPLNVELKIGAVLETVTGESPIVDVQSTTRRGPFLSLDQ